VLLDVGLAVVGECGRVAAVDPFELDEALVLELLEDGIDGAGAGRPGTVASFRDLLDQLVSVGRILGEQQESGGPDVAALSATSTAATSSGVSVAGTDVPAELAGIVSASAAAVVGTTAIHVVGAHGGSLSVWRRRRSPLSIGANRRRSSFDT
jgi:hypothetical protein